MATKKFKIRHTTLVLLLGSADRDVDGAGQSGNASGMEGNSPKHLDRQKQHRHFCWSQEHREVQNAFQKAEDCSV